MQAIQIISPGHVSLVDQKIPVPKRGEALLRLLYGGICGSDLGSYRGTFAYVSYPRIPGHEFSAEIIEVNADHPTLKPGMVVTANPYFNCGRCYACKKNLVNACMDNQTMGVQRDGAFSTYITMPVERIYDGKGLDAKTLALIEPFCISYHGVNRATVRPGERTLVIGGGTIGLLAAQAARLFGSKVWVADIAAGKLELATQFGFTNTIINDGDEHFAQQVRAATDGAGFDVVVEAVGLGATFLQSVDAAAHGGRVVQIGVGKESPPFNFTLIQKKELTLLGSRNATREDFLALIDLVKGRGLDLSAMVSRTYAYDDAPRAFAEFSQQSGTLLKVLLDFTANEP